MFDHRHRWGKWSDPERLDRFTEHALIYGTSRYPVVVLLQERRCETCNLSEAHQAIVTTVKVPEVFTKAFVRS